MSLEQLTLSDEQVQDIVASLITGGGGSDVVYDDTNDTLTVSLSDSISVNTLETTGSINTADLSTASTGDALKKASSGTDLEFGSAGISLSNLATSDGWYFSTKYESIDGYDKFLSGSASVSLNSDFVSIETGTTADSSAQLKKIPALANQGLSWDKKRHAKWFLSRFDTNGDTRCFWGSPFSAEHIGFRGTNGDIVGETHDGTTQNQITLITNATQSDLSLRFELTPSTQVDFYVNGTKQGDITNNIPTGTDQARTISFRAANPALSENVNLDVVETRLVEEP